MRDKVSRINSGGIITNLTHNAIGQLTQATNGKSNSQSFTHDVLMRNTHDNLAQITDFNDNTATYTYDDLGNLNTQISPDTGTTTYTYDNGQAINSLKLMLEALPSPTAMMHLTT